MFCGALHLWSGVMHRKAASCAPSDAATPPNAALAKQTRLGERLDNTACFGLAGFGSPRRRRARLVSDMLREGCPRAQTTPACAVRMSRADFVTVAGCGAGPPGSSLTLEPGGSIRRWQEAQPALPWKSR